jgi:lipoate---protein ligase
VKVFVSPFNNPFLNLSLEDYFLRGGADLPVLFLYINRPCVVLGRFQNPWLECNVPFIVENDIWLVRRQSGGGCVYHDLGNLNFSFITADSLLNRRKHAELLQQAFAKAQIDLEISARHDLWLEGRKISGSAFKQTKDGSFHHGTFLVNSDLLKLEEALKHTLVPSETKSIASVRSKVITLEEKLPFVQISDVVEIISSYFQSVPSEIDGSLLSQPKIQENFKHLRSWEWLWGETPEFKMELGKQVIKVRKGEVLEPFKAAFTPENLTSFMGPAELLKYFPDFSEQHRLSNQIL